MRFYNRAEHNALKLRASEDRSVGQMLLLDIASSSYIAGGYFQYENALKPVSEAYSIKDIEDFYRRIGPVQNGGALGEFLSAAINLKIRERQSVVLDNKGIKLHGIGLFQERGAIIIPNDVGSSVAQCMRGGSILIRGNAEYDLGIYGSGGEVVLFGNSKSRAGYGISGINLFIIGNSGEMLGENSLSNSIITVTGSYGRADSCCAMIRTELPLPR
ncbi:MAG: hypothetical protein KGI06_01815 [Candidatus Micrarchaeota archaeon]|nr:hypothetical protein [Candidatus Micrarchaeota archaeon]